MGILESEIKERIGKQKTIDDLRLEEVELVWEQIIEHAKRRADLFFYLLIAVYKKKIVFEKDETVKQHGKGCPQYGSNACHSSLFPNIMPGSLLAGTHFGETLNMTVELPRIVNVFDMHLEGKVHDQSDEVRKLTHILNDVSAGKITPQKGMDEFYQTMEVFFAKEDYTKISEPQRAIRKVWEYQFEGTFHGANKKHSGISDEYLYLLLRVKQEDIKWIERMPSLVKDYFKNKLLEKYYLQLQQEIAESKPIKKIRHHSSHFKIKEIRNQCKEADKQKHELNDEHIHSFKMRRR